MGLTTLCIEGGRMGWQPDCEELVAPLCSTSKNNVEQSDDLY